MSGRPAIREMFASGFASAKMTCIVENIFEDGEWAILEWDCRYRQSERSQAMTRNFMRAQTLLGCAMSVLAFIVVAPVLASEPELCNKYPRKIEPDMQIKESDLGTKAAIEAAKYLEQNSSNVVGDKNFGTLNRLKVVLGYTLRRQALEDTARFGESSVEAKASAAAFCTWLVEKGFWYD